MRHTLLHLIQKKLMVRMLKSWKTEVQMKETMSHRHHPRKYTIWKKP